MLDNEILSEIIADQRIRFEKEEPWIARDISFDKYIKTKQITVISGIRRSGKSTLLKQFSRKFPGYCYINFDDERLLDFTVKDFQPLMLLFKASGGANTVFLDEIQNISGWERFVRRIHDEGCKIFLTGSNAKLLSSELATRLTGRYVKIELYPFSFKEFLASQNVDYTKKDSINKAKVLKSFDEYLLNGGFPEFINYGDKEFLKRVYDDILYKDLLVRFNIKETKSFKQLASFLFTNFTKEISYNSLKNSLGFKSATSVKNYTDYMQESFLLFELFKYDFSLKKQFVSDKKIYVIDNGLRNAVAFYFSKDYGKLLENLVFIELKRRGADVYFYKDKRECDFITIENSKVSQLFQVSTRIEPGVNEDREIEGIIEAMEKFDLKTGTILTFDQEEKRRIDGRIIRLLPVRKWLLE